MLARIGQGVVFSTSYRKEWIIPTDQIVMVTARRSNDLLVRQLGSDASTLAEHGIQATYAIGDCVAPRMIADSIFDGHRLAREIDSPKPTHARRYIRERGHDGWWDTHRGQWSWCALSRA